MTDEIWQARVDLAAALRLAERFGFSEGICNHFSYALPGRNDIFLLNSYGRHWSEMRASDIQVVNAEGKVLEGPGETEMTAFWIHSRVHLREPRARACFHTHMPWATTITSMKGGRLLPCAQSALMFWNEVAYDDDYNGLADGLEEGERIAAALQGKSVAFLANHGVMVVDESIGDAFDRLYYLERACQLQVMAMQTGQPLKLVSDNIAGKTKAQMDKCARNGKLHFAALKRTLDREGQDYAT